MECKLIQTEGLLQDSQMHTQQLDLSDHPMHICIHVVIALQWQRVDETPTRDECPLEDNIYMFKEFW